MFFQCFCLCKSNVLTTFFQCFFFNDKILKFLAYVFPMFYQCFFNVFYKKHFIFPMFFQCFQKIKHWKNIGKICFFFKKHWKHIGCKKIKIVPMFFQCFSNVFSCFFPIFSRKKKEKTLEKHRKNILKTLEKHRHLFQKF